MSRSTSPPTQSDKLQALIKAAVEMRGETLSSLSLKNGLAENACRDALRQSRPKAEKVIADLLGKDVREIWPERYPSHERGRIARNRKPSQRQIQRAV